MVVRLLLVVCAAGLIALGAGRAHARSQCAGAGHDAFAIATRKLPEGEANGVARRLIDHCRGAEQLTNGVSALIRVRATDAATTLADAAVRREPQRRDSWLALAAVRRLRGDDAGNRAALARARQLDPLSFRRPA